MKKIVYLTLYASLLSCFAFAQNPSSFSTEIEPSTGNTGIKLDCRIFNGGYTTPTDFLDVLAISQDCTVFDPDTKKFAPMKGGISSVYTVWESGVGSASDSNATVFATLDANKKDVTLNDGGGLIFFKIKRDKATGAWKVVNNGSAGLPAKPIFFRNVSFKNLEGGATIANNSINFVTTHSNATHTVLVTEGGQEIMSNKDLVGFADTSDYTYPASTTFPTIERSLIRQGTKVKKYQTMGWPIQINTSNGEVVGKVHRLGRGVTVVANTQLGTIVILGGNPSIIAKYSPLQGLDKSLRLDYPEADKERVKQGDVYPYLYAYKQNEDGTGGFTVPFGSSKKAVLTIDQSGNIVTVDSLYQNLDSLILAKESALKNGATMFANIGDVVESTDSQGNPILIVSEKGVDDSGDWYNNPSKIFKGQLAKHLKDLDNKDGNVDGKFNDYYGRLLAITGESVGTSTVATLVEGGASKNGGKYFFSNPDKLEMVINTSSNPENPSLFIVKENVPSVSEGRNPVGTTEENRTSEAYFLEIGSSGYCFPVDYMDPNMAIKAVPFEDFKLYATSSKGTSFAGQTGIASPNSGTFLRNGATLNQALYDTYLTVVKGKSETDKSMIVAVRNIFPDPTTNCLPEIVTGLFGGSMVTDNSFTVWPNPSKGVLNTKEADNYTVSDLQGLEVASFQQTTSMDLSNLQKGIYFVKNTKGAVKKIVLE